MLAFAFDFGLVRGIHPRSPTLLFIAFAACESDPFACAARRLAARYGALMLPRTLAALQLAVAWDFQRTGIISAPGADDKRLCDLSAAVECPTINPSYPGGLDSPGFGYSDLHPAGAEEFGLEDDVLTASSWRSGG